MKIRKGCQMKKVKDTIIETIKKIEISKIFNDITKNFKDTLLVENKDHYHSAKINNLEYQIKEEVRISSVYSEENLVFSGEIIATRTFDDDNGYLYSNINKSKMKEAKLEISNKPKLKKEKRTKNSF
jgi:hypothetical protein